MNYQEFSKACKENDRKIKDEENLILEQSKDVDTLSQLKQKRFADFIKANNVKIKKEGKNGNK